jgi:hypothetical protein
MVRLQDMHLVKEFEECAEDITFTAKSFFTDEL